MKTVIKVNGMMCEGCEKRVNRALSNLDGVVACMASASEHQVEIEYDEAIVSNEDIKETIEEVGHNIA